MNRIRMRHLIALLLAGLLAGAAPLALADANPCAGGGRRQLDDDGIGGTGARPEPQDDDGIGGTGARPLAPDDDGIGGTGISASGDTGVIGTITGFGSICVGEIEIHYGPTTPVEIDGVPARAADLAVGQVVEVVAQGSGEQLAARAIAVRHVVVGPVTEVASGGAEIGVAGQTVLLPAEVDAGSIVPGAVVRVSGMRRGDGVVVASRITPAEAGDVVDVTGPLAELDSGALTVGGAEVLVDGQAGAEAGDEVRVVGRWLGDAIRAESIEPLPRVPFAGRVARVDIEGFARAVDADRIQVGPYTLDADTADLTPGARVRVEGLVQDRRVVVERVSLVGGAPARPEKPQHGHPGHGGAFDDAKPGSGGPGRPPLGPRGGAPGEDRPPHPRHGAPPPRPDNAGMPEAPARPEHPEHPEHPDPPERPERPPNGERPDRPQLPDGVGRPEIPERPERPAPPERPDLPKPERPERPDMARPERPPPLPERPFFERPPQRP